MSFRSTSSRSSSSSSLRPRSCRVGLRSAASALGFGLLCFACSGESTPNDVVPGGGSGGEAGSSGAGGSMLGGASGASGTGGGAGGATDGGAAGNGGAAGAAGGGAAGAAAGGAAGSSGAAGAAGGGDDHRSAGCGKMRTLEDGVQRLQSGGMDRSYRLRVPANYDPDQPYRLILGFHGAGGSSNDVAPSFFGLWDLADDSTIFAAPDATGGVWKPEIDTPLTSDMIAQLGDELCIDTSRIVIEGFSHGGAMTWTLACALPGVFSAAVVHSGGGLPMPTNCEPIPFWSALGDDGSGQDMSSDYFGRVNGCTVEALAMPPGGGHACTNYADCDEGFPTRWCDYDGGHTPSHVDSGANGSWVPQEVWDFITQF